MKELCSRRRRGWLGGLTAFVGVGLLAAAILSAPSEAAAETIFVKPGDVVSVPWPIRNADDQGNPGGDTINSIKVIVTGDSAFVTNPTESATETLAPGEVKTFTPTFVVGNVLDGTYEVRLKIVSPDPMDPAPSDPAGDLLVSFNIVAPGGPQAQLCSDSESNLPAPTPGLGVEINASTGESGPACAGTSSSGHKPKCVRTLAGTENCYPEPQSSLEIAWACSSPGTYDIPISFQDDGGNWSRTHTIHCRDAPAKITACTPGQSCQEIALSANFNLANSTITAVIEEGSAYCGGGDACQMIERIGGGKCEIVGFGGCSAIRWSRLYHNTLVAAAGMFYFPPEDRDFLRNEPFTVNFSLNGGSAFAAFTYPVHNSRGATVRLPALGQPHRTCGDDPLLCLVSGGSSGGPSWGDGPPPIPQPNSPPPPPPPPGAPAPTPDPMQQAAAAQGRSMLGGSVRIGNAATIFGREMTLTHSVEVPSYQPTAGAEICRWTGTAWSCEGPASAACTGGTCLMTAGLRHASTWAFLAPLPAFYPDLTGPNITELQISENGTAWNAPGALIQTTSPFVRVTARDPPSGVELISGLAVSSSPLPFTSADPSLVLHLHLDEGSGSQLFDSSRYASTGTVNLTPAWVAGRFGSALEFTGTGSQQASAPVATRVDSGPFSISAWVYPTDSAGTRFIAKKGAAFNRFFNFVVASGKLQAIVGDGSIFYSVTSAESLPLNRWSLVAMSFDGTKLRIFSNGEQKGEVAAGYAGSDSTVVIGSLWKGRIDELRILTRAIGRAEAALDFRRGFAAIATGDGWRTTKLATQYDHTGLSEGQAGPAVLTASGFSLARSTYAVFVELAVADVAGHFASAAFRVPVAPADTTPLAFSGAEISSNTSSWYPHGAITLPGTAALRVKVQDPASGDALRSGIATSTEAVPFLPDPHTQLLLHLDEGTGSFTIDSSARASAVTIQNAPAWAPGRFGAGLGFTSDYQYLVPSDSPPGLDAPNWTANVWVYPTEVANGWIFSKVNDSRYGFFLRTTNGRPQLNVRNSAAPGGITITAPDVLPLNQWTSLTATSDQSMIRLYVNGQLKASAPGYMEPNSATFVIGAFNTGVGSWRGRLDEIRFMSRPQSPAEVLLDYRRGYAALFSSNGGASWTLPALSYGPAVEGALDAVLTASGLTLADSLTSNVLQFFAADAAGNTSSATFVLPAALDAAAPAAPVIVSTRLAAGGAVIVAWEPTPGEVPVSYDLYRATEPIISLAGLLPVATTSALNALDAPSGSEEVVYYALTARNLQGKVSEPSSSVRVLFDRTPLDGIPPQTTLIAGTPQFSSTTLFVTTATAFSLIVSEPARTFLAVDSSTFAAYSGTFTLTAPGAYTVQFYSIDLAGNVEATRSTQAAVDGLPPRTAASFGEPKFAGSLLYLSSRSAVQFTAVDDLAAVGDERGAGAAQTLLSVDSAAFAAAVSTVILASEGVHSLSWFSRDRLGNAESVASTSVAVDLTPPDSSLAIGAPSFDPGDGRPVFVASATLLTLSAQDPTAAEVASGVRMISWRRGGEAFAAYAAPFGPGQSDGLKTLEYLATDNVGNQEIARSTTVALDDTPPLTSLAVLGGRQFPGPDAASFFASSDTRFALPAADPVVGGVASGLALTRWQDNGGAFQSFTAPFGLAEGSRLLAYQSQDRVLNMEVPRSTTVLVDAAPPVTTAHIGAPSFAASDGTNFITPATPVAFFAVDPAMPGGLPGSGVSRIEIAIDGGPFAVYSAALTFAEGRHTILYRAVDNVANVSVIQTLLVQSDATPPLSSLVIGAPRFQLPSVLLVSTRTPFGIAAADPVVHDVASGVKDTSFRVSDLAPGTDAFSAFSAPFTMAGADVTKVIEFFSRDNVLNAEVVKSSTVLLDSAPPEVALLSPASCGAGICRVLKGRFPVLGTARDLHFGSYRLEFAPGQDAATGFALINSGTLAVSSGTLGVWDATALSGWFTVRLNAADLVENTAAVALNVFVGDPGRSLMLGNHEVFNMPEGVAVGGGGKIYVADRNNDRIAVFSSTGVPLASFGGHKDEDDENKESTTTLRLNKPSGVAVDVDGSIYVADTNRHRVLKLSAAGEVLLSLGGFKHPAGVAVDAARNIYVADTGNGRVRVFSSAGAFSFQFDLPPIAAGRDDDDDAGEGGARRGEPFGIAVDAAGSIYVADPKGGRALKFGATGELLLSIPIPGDKPGKQGQPFGMAVSSGGDCLLVSDRKTSRVHKFDFQGNSNLLFGAKGKLKDDDVPASGAAIAFLKPMGLALDDQGNLFVADRNNNRVHKFGLPTGEGPLVVPAPKPGEEHVARGVVDVEDGGKVERRDLAAVDIPAGAVAADLKITVSTPAFHAADDSNRRRAAEDARLKTASPPVKYGPEGTTFKGEVTLTLPYSPELLALQNIDEAHLRVRYWNPGKSQWEELVSVVDPKTRTVKAKTTHFSLYQVFSGTVSAAAVAPLAADTAFAFRDAYAFPNPVRGSGPITIRIQTGLADSVEVRVYDISGRKIHSSSNFTLAPNLDDGNGKGAQYTYDHVWDISGAGSGVYRYVITAKKGGQSDIHKTGRVGVVK